jgi:hypothetical protein
MAEEVKSIIWDPARTALERNTLGLTIALTYPSVAVNFPPVT